MPNRFTQPHSPSTGAPVGGAPLEIAKIELIQSVQDEAGSVPLIAHKPTVVRIHPKANSLARKSLLRCELMWRRQGSEQYLPSGQSLELDPSAHLELDEQRATLGSSFNIPLPAGAIGPGKLEVRIAKIRRRDGAELALRGPTSARVEFEPGPTLRVRAVGLRYVGANQKRHAPEALHFAYLRSFLRRAYPVAVVEWSQIVIDADFAPPFNGNTPVEANAQLAAMRSVEVSAGMDPRTHYYGLVSDGDGAHFMRGRASSVPGIPSPDAVASGPVGTPGAGFPWDNDESYADWYGAHELAHTYGRYHPGFPPGSQDKGDEHYPYDHGKLSEPGKSFVGFDVGDASLQLPMRALSGKTHHDIMTYGDHQWVSDYTFRGILERLRQEEGLV